METIEENPSPVQFVTNWIAAMLDDKLSPIRLALSPAQQGLMRHLINNTWEEALVEQFTPLVDQERFTSEWESKYEDFVSLLHQDETPTIGTLVAYVLAAIDEAISGFSEKLREGILLLKDLLYDVLMLVVKLLTHLKLPENVIPSQVFHLITQGRNIHVFDLLMAMPVTTIKSLLETSLDEIKNWVEQD